MRIRGKGSSHSFCAATIEQGDSNKSPEFAIPTKEEEKEKGSSSSSSKKACDDENGVETSDFSCKILHVSSSKFLIKEGIHTELERLVFKIKRKRTPRIEVKRTKNNNNDMEEQVDLQQPELPVNNNMEEQNEIQQPELPVNNNNNNMEQEQNELQQPELPVNNNNNNMEQEQNNPDQPELPIEFQEKIQELGGSEVKLVIQKRLHKSDVNTGNNRFSIPNQQILARDFLTQEEVTLLNEREGGKPAGLTVNVLDPSLKLWERLCLKKWDMTSSPTYNIIRGWMKVVKNSALEAEDVVQLWSFRNHGQLNFALVKL